MSKYKIGDKVVIHSLEYLEGIAKRVTDYNDLVMPNSFYFTHEMKNYCGKIVTIKSIDYTDHPSNYTIKESGYYWEDTVIAGLATFNLGEIYA